MRIGLLLCYSAVSLLTTELANLPLFMEPQPLYTRPEMLDCDATCNYCQIVGDPIRKHVIAFVKRILRPFV